MSALASLLLAGLLGLPTPTPMAPPPPEGRLQELIKKLGDKSYRVREDAARELLRYGPASVAALTAGTKDTDLEVSERCRQLLPVAESLERNQKLAALVKNPSAPPPKGLAGLERFLKVTGDDKAARELYAEMMGIHHRTIEAAEKDPRVAAEQYRQFSDEIYNRWNMSARAGRYSYDNLFSGQADITFFLFLSGDKRVRAHENGMNQAYVLLYGNQIPKAISEKEGTLAMRKLFLDWLENEPQPYLQQRGFQLAAQAGIKEALPVVLRMLKKTETDGHSAVQVMTALTKLGSKEHIPLLDKYLSDTNVVTTINFGNGDQLSAQVRDVAMGVQVRLAGQKLTDYGFDGRFGGNDGLSYHYYAFRDEKSRDDAHAKWKEWKAKNLEGKAPEKKEPAAKQPAKDGPTEPKADPKGAAGKAEDKPPPKPDKK
jgi:hypothetical protein